MSYKSGRYFIALLAILHLVGVAGLAWTQTRAIFLLLSPIQLLVTLIAVVFLHPKENGSIWHFLVPAAIIGWTVEAVGVGTGAVFGQYAYGTPLGPGLLGVPLIIGINWATLSYCVANLASPLPYPVWGRCMATGLLLTGFDALMEPAATRLGLWTWANGFVPGSNYVGWFATGTALAAVYFATLARQGSNHRLNPLAGPVLIIQLAFFLGIWALA